MRIADVDPPRVVPPVKPDFQHVQASSTTSRKDHVDRRLDKSLAVPEGDYYRGKSRDALRTTTTTTPAHMDGSCLAGEQNPVRESDPPHLFMPKRVDKAVATPCPAYRRHSSPWVPFSMSLFLLACMLLQPALAVLIPFDNCLPDSYKYNSPKPLQWVPLYVDAAYENQNRSHSLRVTVWGNVTGAVTNVTLPPADSDLWSNSNYTDGKILDNPNPDSPNPLLTTLHSKIDILTYEPYSQNTDFCNTSLTNATCPLGPVWNTSGLLTRSGLPSVTMKHDFYTSYAFTSFSPTFLILYGDSRGTTIGCVSTTVTPSLGNLEWMLKFLPVIVLLFVGFATVFAAIYSPWGTADIFHWSSNFGRHNDLLRLVTPGFGDCLQYIQFVALTGSLTLSYPGFFQPIVSQASWSALMFNESFVSNTPGWQNLVDGVYYTNGTYGLEKVAQLVGMRRGEDIWAGMMVWLLVIMGSVLLITQLGFGVQWVYRSIKMIPEEDLRNKNLPFSVGNMVRIVFNFFLMPLVALSTFQLVVASNAPAFTVALAAVTIVLLLVFAGWLLYLITTTKPRSVLFDDLPTVLLYGPLYNTYSDEAAAFALIPVLLTFVRGVAVGAVQPAGIAQIIILAICEVVQIITLHAFKPFSSPTSMNAYHTLFSALRFTSIILMTAFIPQLGVTDGPKGWIGYSILLIHAGVLVLGFFLNALQTSIEVLARLMGAGGDDTRGLQLGPLQRIFGARQLSRRTSRRGGPSRQSQLSSVAMLSAEDAGKTGYVAPGGRLRSESAGSMGVMMNHRHHRSSSALDSLDLTQPPARGMDAMSSATPTTPGEASNYSFLPSPSVGQARPPAPPSALLLEQNTVGDTFYRPPRKRGQTFDNGSGSPARGARRGSWDSTDWSQRPNSQVIMGSPHDGVDPEAVDRGATPVPYSNAALAFPTRTDYSTREVDFYYGVQRGERLNRDVPQRKLGTGPADPTGTMASATGWLRNWLLGKRKEKGKGFEVVRSSRMPPAMRVGGGDYEDDAPPEGMPVAMGVLRNGPIDSDDDDPHPTKTERAAGAERRSEDSRGETQRLNDGTSSRGDDSDVEEIPKIADAPPVLPGIEPAGSIHVPSRIQSKVSRRTAGRGEEPGEVDMPEVPRKSSRRKSLKFSNDPGFDFDFDAPQQAQNGSSFLDHVRSAPPTTTSRLPFEPLSRDSSRTGASSAESRNDDDDGGGGAEVHCSPTTSIGHVHQGSISRFPSDQRGKVPGSSAELVNR